MLFFLWCVCATISVTYQLLAHIPFASDISIPTKVGDEVIVKDNRAARGAGG